MSRYSPTAPASVPTSGTLWLAAPIEVRTPEAVTLTNHRRGIQLNGGDVQLRFTTATNTTSGDGLSGRTLPARLAVEIELTWAGNALPRAVVASLLPGWRDEFGDASAALSFPDSNQSDDAVPLVRRERVLADEQEHISQTLRRSNEVGAST